MGEDQPTQEGDPLRDYPFTVQGMLSTRAHNRFRRKTTEYGRGRSWRECPPTAMAWAAVNKLHAATTHIEAGRPDAALEALTDASNYICFEADRLHHSQEVDDGE